MQSSSTFIRISEHTPQIKNYELINDWENIIGYWEELKQSEVKASKCCLFQIYFKDLNIGATLGKFCCFYSHLGMGTVFPALKLTHNCYINKHFFFLKNGDLILNWVHLSYKYNLPERIS